MPRRQIKVMAYALFRHGNRVLVQQIDQKKKQRVFYQPLCVEVKVGERSHEALTKEIEEEFGVEIARLFKKGVLELMLDDGRRKRHEVAFIFEGTFVPGSAHNRPFLVAYKGREKVTAVWKPITDFTQKKDRIFPEVFLGFVESMAREIRTAPVLAETERN